jgi:hypothetical protein
MKRCALLLAAATLAVGCGDSTTSPSPMMTPTEPPPTAAPVTPDAEAGYRVTFQATWSRATQPDRFPPNPHFSPLVGATHNGTVRFWEVGAIASDGIERMAELGSVSPLDSIMGGAIGRGQAQTLLRGNGLNPSPAETSFEFTISRDFPFVTLVSMIAPSPDWFVGISARNFLESGNWPDSIAFELFPYDAGTDSGTIYDALDADTQPRMPISRIEGVPFLSGAGVRPLGTFTFTRLG